MHFLGGIAGVSEMVWRVFLCFERGSLMIPVLIMKNMLLVNVCLHYMTLPDILSRY